MTEEQLRNALAKASKSVQRLNEHLARVCPTPPEVRAAAQGKRIRQNPKPMLNKLEQEFYRQLQSDTDWTIYPQSLRFKLANGVHYTPDFYCTSPVVEGDACYEVKGKHAWEDSLVKIKMAAHQYPHIVWYLVWKEDGEWQYQRVLP